MQQIVDETPRKTTAMTNQDLKLDELYPLFKTSTEARMNFDMRMRMEFDNLAGPDIPVPATLDPDIVINPLPANAPESTKNQMELLQQLKDDIITEETYLQWLCDKLDGFCADIDNDIMTVHDSIANRISEKTTKLETEIKPALFALKMPAD